MAINRKITGIVLRTTPYDEKDLIVNVLTNESLITFMAKGVLTVNSKRAASLTPMTYGEYDLSETNKKNQCFLLESNIIFGQFDFLGDILRLVATSFINEIILKMFSEEDMPSVFPYLLNSIKLIKDGVEPYSVILMILCVSLRLNGYGLYVDGSIYSDKKTDIVGISYIDGGLVSRDEFDNSMHVKCSPRKTLQIRFLFKLEASDMNKFTPSKEEAKELLNEMLIYAYDKTGVRFKSESSLSKL